jgi:hypothetical protein
MQTKPLPLSDTIDEEEDVMMEVEFETLLARQVTARSEPEAIAQLGVDDSEIRAYAKRVLRQEPPELAPA